MHPLYRFTHIGRPLDPREPSNRLALWLMAAAGLGLATLALVRGAGPVEGLVAGGHGALVAFVTWALGRELAPDEPPVASVAAVFALLAAAAGLPVDVAGPVALLLLVRVVNRTVGPPPKPHDVVLTILVVAAVAWPVRSWGLLATAGLAFGLDGILRVPGRGSLAVATGLLLAAVAAGVANRPGVPSTDAAWLAVAVVLAAFALRTFTQGPPTAQPDVGDGQLDAARVRAGGAVVAAYAVCALLSGPDAVTAAAVVGAAMVGSLSSPLWSRRPRSA